jgi:hypothetical protein
MENNAEKKKSNPTPLPPTAALPVRSIPLRQRILLNELARLLNLIQAKSLPSRPPLLVVLEEILSLLGVGIAQFLVGLLALVRLGVVLFLLVDLPFLGGFPAFLFPSVGGIVLVDRSRFVCVRFQKKDIGCIESLSRQMPQ